MSIILYGPNARFTFFSTLKIIIIIIIIEKKNQQANKFWPNDLPMKILF